MWQHVRIEGARRPRLLLESAAGAYEFADFDAFHNAGFDVLSCSGPLGADRCPLVEHDDCAYARDADVIYFGLDLDDPLSRTIFLSLRGRFPRTPLVVEVLRGQPPAHRELLAGCDVLEWPASLNAQVRAIRKALHHTAVAG